MINPPSLLFLTVDSALRNLSHISNLSSLPDHILLDLFLRKLRVGKLDENVRKLFVATGKDEILVLIQGVQSSSKFHRNCVSQPFDYLSRNIISLLKKVSQVPSL